MKVALSNFKNFYTKKIKGKRSLKGLTNKKVKEEYGTNIIKRWKK